MTMTMITASADCNGVISWTVTHDAAPDAVVTVLEVWTTAPGGLAHAAPGVWVVGANVTVNGRRVDTQGRVTVPEPTAPECQRDQGTTTVPTTAGTVPETAPTAPTVPETAPTATTGPNVPGTVLRPEPTAETTATTAPRPTLPATGAGQAAGMGGAGVALVLVGAVLVAAARRRQRIGSTWQ
jgi:LPXTG-motif cell wall-anchored protein